MARMQLGTFKAIAGGLVGAAIVLGPSIGSATGADEARVRLENNRIESQRRARLVRNRTTRVSQQNHWNAKSSPTTSTVQRPGGLPLAGLAAGDEASAFSGWTDLTATFSDNGADSDLVSLSVGGDSPLGERFLVGGFLSYTNTDTDGGGIGHTESHGVSLGPYGSVVLTDFLDFDASLGGAFDQVDVSGGPDNDSNSFFISSNLNAFHYVDNFGVRGRVGVVYSDAAIDNAADIDFGQVQFGLEGSYYVSKFLFGAQWLPSLTLDYNNDFSGTPGGDDDEFILGAAIYVFSEGNLSASFDYGTVLGRSNFDSHTISFGLSYRF